MANDARKFPLEGGEVVGAPPTLETIGDEALAEAGLAIMLETKGVPGQEEVQAAFEARGGDPLLLGLGCYEDDDEDVKISAMRSAYDVSHCPSHTPSLSLSYSPGSFPITQVRHPC